MNKISKILALVMFAAAGPASQAQAEFKRQEKVIVFYNNENHDSISGQRVIFCDGSSFHTGVATLFDEEIYYGC